MISESKATVFLKRKKLLASHMYANSLNSRNILVSLTILNDFGLPIISWWPTFYSLFSLTSSLPFPLLFVRIPTNNRPDL